MIDLGFLPGPIQGTLVVAAIVVQAVALYVGYGAIERGITPLIELVVEP